MEGQQQQQIPNSNSTIEGISSQSKCYSNIYSNAIPKQLIPTQPINILSSTDNSGIIKFSSLSKLLSNIKTIDQVDDIRKIKRIILDESYVLIYPMLEIIYNKLYEMESRLKIDVELATIINKKFTNVCVRSSNELGTLALFNLSKHFFYCKNIVDAHEYAVRAHERGHPYGAELVWITKGAFKTNIQLINPSITLAMNAELSTMWLMYLRNRGLFEVANWYKSKLNELRYHENMGKRKSIDQSNNKDMEIKQGEDEQKNEKKEYREKEKENSSGEIGNKEQSNDKEPPIKKRKTKG